jgi:hypothetical protein
VPRNVEKLVSNGLVEKIGGQLYWNAYYFGFFFF